MVEESFSCKLKPRQRKGVLATSCTLHWECTYFATQTAKCGYIHEVKEMWFLYQTLSCNVFYILTIGDLPTTVLRNGKSAPYRKWFSVQQLHLLSVECSRLTTPMIKMPETPLSFLQILEHKPKAILNSHVGTFPAYSLSLLWSAILYTN